MVLYCIVLYCIVLYCIVLYVPVIKWSPVEFGRVLFSKTNKTASAFSQFTFMHSDFNFCTVIWIKFHCLQPIKMKKFLCTV